MTDRFTDAFAAVWAVVTGLAFALGPLLAAWSRSGTDVLCWPYVYVLLVSITGLALRAYGQAAAGHRRNE